MNLQEIILTDECSPDWDLIRLEYLAGKSRVIDIAKRFGVSQSAIMQRRLKEGWAGRNKIRTPSRKLLIARMFMVLEKQIERMEISMVEGTDDKEITLLGQLVRSLEKLVELDTKQQSLVDANVKTPGKSSSDMQELRMKLNRRINQLEAE